MTYAFMIAFIIVHFVI